MIRFGRSSTVGVLVWVGAIVCAAAWPSGVRGDWPQWRGSSGDGVSPGGPKLAEDWGKDGPPQLWMSEKIVGGAKGGYGSVSVADGKAYIYVNQKYKASFERRELTGEALRRLGWFAQKLPAELSKAVEEARVSEERAKLIRKDVGPWVQKWLNDHLSEADRKTLGRQAADRLNRGKNALSYDALDKLATIKGREFPSQAELDKWYEANAFTPELKKAVTRLIPTFHQKAYDIVYCLDKNGKTAWQFKTDSFFHDHSRSPTPAVVGRKVFVPAGNGYLYCLGAERGEVIWKTGALLRPRFYRSAKATVASYSPAPAGGGFSGKVETVVVTYTYSVADKPYKGVFTQELFPGRKGAKPKTKGYQPGWEITAWYDPDQPGKSMLDPIAPPPFSIAVHGSVAATADVAVLLARQLTAFDAATGATLWTQPKVRSDFPVNSPVLWKSGERTFVLCNLCNVNQVACVDLKTGEILWTVPGGGMSTVAAQGEYMVVQTLAKKVGILGYKISPAKAEKVWNVVAPEDSASPIIHKGHVFAIAKNRAVCVELASGKVCWDEWLRSAYGSPVLADGKIFANSRNVLVMLPATPEKFVQPVKSKIKMCEHTSPAVADGKLYLRLPAGVGCFDLTAAGAASGPAEAGASKK